MSDYNSKCNLCGSDAYTGLTLTECSNDKCDFASRLEADRVLSVPVAPVSIDQGEDQSASPYGYYGPLGVDPSVSQQCDDSTAPPSGGVLEKVLDAAKTRKRQSTRPVLPPWEGKLQLQLTQSLQTVDSLIASVAEISRMATSAANTDSGNIPPLAYTHLGLLCLRAKLSRARGHLEQRDLFPHTSDSGDPRP